MMVPEHYKGQVIQILQLPCKQNRSREGTPTADAWGKCRQYKWQQKL